MFFFLFVNRICYSTYRKKGKQKDARNHEIILIKERKRKKGESRKGSKEILFTI